MISRIMNRLIHGLGDPKGSSWSSLEKKPATGMSILSFISVSKDLARKPEPDSQLKQRILEAFFRHNDNSRSYYLDERTKQLFSRCLRLFFFY
jgi:hypothetical protein